MTLGQKTALMKRFPKKAGEERLEPSAESTGRSGASWGDGAVQGGEQGGLVRGQKGENKCLVKAGRRDSFRVGLWPVAEEEDGVWLDVFVTV